MDAVATMGAVLPDDAGGRDAVHVAVVSARAGERLWPGTDVGLTGDLTTEAVAIHSGEPTFIGIVDPFIKGAVQPDERFWLYLYPRTITGLNHQWTHPAFPDAKAGEVYGRPSAKLASEQWLRDFCACSDGPGYETVIAMATDDRRGRSMTVMGYDASGEIPPEFWDHVEVVTGQTIPEERRAEYFSCSC